MSVAVIGAGAAGLSAARTLVEAGLDVTVLEARDRIGVLATGGLEFVPSLPEEKTRAIQTINRGHITKILLRLDEVYWPPTMTFLATPLSTQLWWRPGQGQANETPVLTAFFGGADAANLEGASDEEAADIATTQLGDILGRSMHGHVLKSRHLAWGSEQFTRMGYSSLPPGGKVFERRWEHRSEPCTSPAKLRAFSTQRPSTVPSNRAGARRWR